MPKPAQDSMPSHVTLPLSVLSQMMLAARDPVADARHWALCHHDQLKRYCGVCWKEPQ